MEWLTVLRDKFKVLIRREQFDRDLEEEMQFHQELQAEELHENGMSADEAQNAARRRFGNTTQLREAGWHAWGWAPLERLFQDLRFTVRSLRRNPGFALSVVLLLALAIWMNTTVYTVIHAVMLAPLPFDRSEELVRLYETNPRKAESQWGVAPASFLDWQGDSHAFSEIAAVSSYPVYISGDGEPEQISAALVTADFFRVLGVRPVIGRTFLAEEHRPVSEGITAAIISHGMWQRRFGGSPGVIGKTLRVSDSQRTVAVTIVGVMPASFASASTSLGPSDCWLPLRLSENQLSGSSRYLNVIARRRPGVSLRQAQAEMDILTPRLQAKRPKANSGWGVRIVDLREAVPGSYRASLMVLFGAVVLVLLIACSNVANLMLSRGAARLREMATRMALGASRLRLVAQLATESIFLSLAAGALGFLLSLASVRAVVAFAPPDLPRLSEVGVDPAVLWFCVLVALATGLICGLLPALRLSGFDLSTTLKEGGTVSSGRARGLLSRSLVVLEVAVSLVLLVGAGLLARSFTAVQTLKFGFQPDHVLAVDLGLDRRKPEAAVRLYRELLPRLQRIPGVEAAAAGPIPPGSTFNSFYYKEGTTERIDCALDAPSTQYFDALHIPLLKGRLFTEAEGSDSRVVIVNRTAARLTWPGEDPIGKRITFGDPGRGQWRTVVGVVEDLPNGGLQTGPRPQVCLPPTLVMVLTPDRLVIRTSGKAGVIAPTVRATIRSLDSQMPIRRVATLEERLASLTAGLRFNTVLMTVFAALAFVLAASGVYSLMSYTVALRTREMSVRMALGADRADILRLIVRNGAVLVGIGVAVGLAGALGAVRFLSSLLYQVKPKDPLAFAAATALLVLAALAACYIPARRAASVDVVETLRQE